MSNNKDFPEYLRELVQSTPSGTTKLIAAWDGLSVESQIQILNELKSINDYPPYLCDKFRDKALNCGNPYVRYLVAKGYYFSYDDIEERKAIRLKIENDSDALVKYCLREEESWLGKELENPEEFYKLPHEARLALIRAQTKHGESIAALIEYAVDNLLESKNITDVELYEILADYMKKPCFKERLSEDQPWNRYDGFGQYLDGRAIDALWNLVTKLPRSISPLLIDCLPEQVGLNAGIPESVLDNLSPYLLQRLLYREDMILEDLRRKIFDKPDETIFSDNREKEGIFVAAISCNFNLKHDDFKKILQFPNEQKIKMLVDLATYARDLNLVFYDAIKDVLLCTDKPEMSAYENGDYAENRMEQILGKLTGYYRNYQIREFRLYKLAKEVVPWNNDGDGYNLRGKLEPLSDKVVKEDTWKTFINFSNAWKTEWPWSTEKLDICLPRLDALNEEYSDQTYSECFGIEGADEIYNIHDENDELVDKVEDKLRDLLNTSFEESEEKQKQIVETISELVADTNNFKETTINTITGLNFQVGEVKKSQTVLKVLLIIVTFLLVWILLKI